MVSDMVESLRSTQITLLIRNAFWVSWGAGVEERYKKINIRARDNRMEQVLRTSFLGTRPRVFAPPGDRFSAHATENRNYNWACPMGSPVTRIGRKASLTGLLRGDFFLGEGGGCTHSCHHKALSPTIAWRIGRFPFTKNFEKPPWRGQSSEERVPFSFMLLSSKFKMVTQISPRIAWNLWKLLTGTCNFHRKVSNG